MIDRLSKIYAIAFALCGITTMLHGSSCATAKEFIFNAPVYNCRWPHSEMVGVLRDVVDEWPSKDKARAIKRINSAVIVCRHTKQWTDHKGVAIKGLNPQPHLIELADDMPIRESSFAHEFFHELMREFYGHPDSKHAEDWLWKGALYRVNGRQP